jgi:hypothetical protein
MTNLQLYLAVGLPVFAIVVALVVNLVQITGIKTDMMSLRGDINGIRGEMNSLRSEINTKLDMILAKFYEHDTEIARLKDKTGLSQESTPTSSLLRSPAPVSAAAASKHPHSSHSEQESSMSADALPPVGNRPSA